MREASRHPAIAAFLSEVDARLRRLPAERRAAECHELAQHLDLLVVAHRARGMDEAVAGFLLLFWSMGAPLPRHLPWVIAVNAIVLPSAFIYSDWRKRRRTAPK